MNKEIEKQKLLAYKRVISSLSTKDALELKKKFDAGEKTGYPSIDRPWEKFYEDTRKEVNPFLNTTPYQGFMKSNFNYLADKALDFFGSKISFGDIKENVDVISKSLEEYGVKKGDFVTVCAVATPELIYTFYALSKVGAVAQMISPFFEPDDIVNRIKECDSKLVIVMDKFYPLFKQKLNRALNNNIVIMPMMNSSILRYITKSSKIDSNKHEISWKQFIRDGKSKEIPKTIEYETNQPAAMVYSSGTTGAAKGIVLSNDSFQKVVNSYGNSGFDTSRGQVLYQNIPPWSSTGISLAINFPLSYGVSIYLDPRFDQNVFIKNILKSKPNYIFTTTTMYQGFTTDKNLKRLRGKDLSFIKYPVEGGEKLTDKDITNIENVFKNHGSSAHLLSGYGLCECGSTITTDIARNKFPRNSSGIPLPDITTVSIFDDNDNELKYNIRGNIMAKTEIGMTGYFKNKNATEKFFYIDSNGDSWSRTGDIGYINDEGALIVEGRKEDHSIINNKFIYNFDIENAILNNDFIEMCEVQTLPNDDNTLFAHIIFDKSIRDKIKIGVINQNELLDLLYENLKKQFNDIDFVPKYYKIDDKFPMAISGKRDIKKLKEDCDNLILIGTDKKEEKVLQK